MGHPCYRNNVYPLRVVCRACSQRQPLQWNNIVPRIKLFRAIVGTDISYMSRSDETSDARLLESTTEVRSLLPASLKKYKKHNLTFTLVRQMTVKELTRKQTCSIIVDMLAATDDAQLLGADDMFFLLERCEKFIFSLRGASRARCPSERVLMRTASAFILRHSLDRLLRVFGYMTKCDLADAIPNLTHTRMKSFRPRAWPSGAATWQLMQ